MARTSPHLMNEDHRAVSGGLARAAVFGISDGLVSNVSLVLGFAGGGVAASVVRLGGLAGAVAGAFSMAAGEWISVSAQNELVEREMAIERRELEKNPEKETLELAAFYEDHGMTREQAIAGATEVMQDKERALLVHAREEFGLDPTDMPSAIGAAALSFVMFIVGAMLPVVPWVFTSGTGASVASVSIGVVSAAAVGAALGVSTERSVARSSVRQVAILLVATGATYLIGTLLGTQIS
ncbi:MAG: VIT1/CCC1 transporter family protein [Actinomycetota bacterium]